METWKIIAIAVGAMAVSMGAILFSMMRLKNSNSRKRKVIRILRQHGKFRGGDVLENVTLPSGKETVHVDAVVAGYFGLLFVSVLTVDGSYYGEEQEQTWTMVRGEERTKFENPLRSGVKAMDAARLIFSKNETYNIPMEQVVVFTTKFDDKTGLYIKDTLPIVDAKKLGALLSKPRFEKDNGVNVERVMTLLKENSIQP